MSFCRKLPWKCACCVSPNKRRSFEPFCVCVRLDLSNYKNSWLVLNLQRSLAKRVSTRPCFSAATFWVLDSIVQDYAKLSRPLKREIPTIQRSIVPRFSTRPTGVCGVGVKSSTFPGGGRIPQEALFRLSLRFESQIVSWLELPAWEEHRTAKSCRCQGRGNPLWRVLLCVRVRDIGNVQLLGHVLA